jgi:hypothetical protein
MNEELMFQKLTLLDLVNQLEREFLQWRERGEELFLHRAYDALDNALALAKCVNEMLPEDPTGIGTASIFQSFAESVDDYRVVDCRFMTVGLDWACKAKVSATAFNTINHTIIHLVEKNAELEDNFLFLRQAIQREASGI